VAAAGGVVVVAVSGVVVAAAGEAAAAAAGEIVAAAAVSVAAGSSVHVDTSPGLRRWGAAKTEAARAATERRVVKSCIVSSLKGFVCEDANVKEGAL
jgi:hypothetical protein